MILILMGPPGVGKGTQAKLLAKKFHILHVSTGDILRAAVVSGSALGQKADSYLQNGDLVPDDIMAEVVAEELARPPYSRGFILDGFPRTITQAEALEQLLPRMDARVDAVLNLEADEAEIIRRLSRRRMCRSCHSIFNLDLDSVLNPAVCPRCGGELYQREDDKEETIRHRMKVYNEVTAPLKNFYAKRRMLYTVNGVGEVEEIFDHILSLVNKYDGNK